MPRIRPGPIVLALLLVLCGAPPVLASSQGGKPIVVFQPGSRPYGKTFGEWSAEWWKWAYSIPVDRNPLFDETGANAGEGQDGQVFYLAGVFNVSGTVTRSVTVPPGKALFFPLLNVEWDNHCPPVDPPMDESQLRAVVNENLDMVSALTCEVDGTELPDLFSYRSTSPSFDVTFPDNNIFQLFGCDHITPGTYSGFVSGGYYVMLAPLPKGMHTIRFGGSVGDPPFFTLDVTYHVFVSPSEENPGPILASVVPNPLNPEAVLRYRVPKEGPVTVTIYDLNGRLVRTLLAAEHRAAGSHQAVIDGRDAQGRKLASGVYFYRVEATDASIGGRFTIMK
ncbi:MAG TPA: FlgD immunoglobulin-like domain containing protein [Candidatus Eisenbacteria bacterium]|nr:FlgD immunoglobulin-like domain containing protein [Candidatus Eisenbacteria bacterium]